MSDRQPREHGELLRQGDWFGRLPVDVQEEILRRSAIRSFTKGQVVQIEDSPTSGGLAAVLEGSLAFLRYATDEEEPALIHLGGPGFWFGEMICLDAGLPAVSVVARTDAKILFLAKAEFDRLASEDFRYYRAVTQLACVRYRLMVRFLAEARELGPDAHLRLRLAELAEMRRMDTGDASRPIDLQISQAELGRLVGLSRQKVNVRLQRLQAEGWIVLRQATITVPDSAALRASAMADGLRRRAPASA